MDHIHNSTHVELVRVEVFKLSSSRVALGADSTLGDGSQLVGARLEHGGLEHAIINDVISDD